jgi:hypothetical protein
VFLDLLGAAKGALNRAAASTQPFGIFLGGLMQFKLSMTLLLLLTLAGCGSQAQNYKLFKLPSGKEIKITGMGKIDFSQQRSCPRHELPDGHIN